ncbi:MAG TPA: hypothetical protein VKZ45_06330 [Vicingaceae bacterium]|nr:hypothetical protein [Vicingaceae bacterium]
MSNIDLSKITIGVLAQQQLEKKISEYKIFYKTHLTNVKNRNEALNKLYPICVKYQKTEPKTAFYTDKEKISLEVETEEVLKKYFSSDILQLFNKEIPTPKPKRQIDYDDSFWLALLAGFANTFETLNEKNKRELHYKRNFLIFLNNCLLNFGLHPDILRRDAKTYKRYNIVIEHFFKSKSKITEHKILLSPETLQQEFLTPYEKKLPIRLNGKLIPFKSIYSIQISSTLLLDDEIELYARKNNFNWTSTKRDDIVFISYCLDETDNLHKNPYLVSENEKFRNQNIYFVDVIRIEELKAIKTKQFDLSKLVRLCEELNNNSVTKNNFSSSLLVRTIIDHIPPIFGFKNFSQLANNYADGTKSFKKSMLNLDNSLRNIADNNIHSQVRTKEVLPTKTQVDFTQELDLLLSEIVRKLK